MAEPHVSASMTPIQDFLAGVRFIESLATWIQQFETTDERETAYAFVRQVLVYIGPAELFRLVDSFYPDHVERQLVESVAAAHNVRPFLVWASAQTTKAYDKLLEERSSSV